jgi:electron transfer flavoprotein beta subunit
MGGIDASPRGGGRTMPNMIVLAKQVFYTQDLRIDRTTKKLKTEGVARVISESDKNAIEEAVRLKEKHGGKITVLTMGPPEAKETLREAIAMGADEGYMLVGPEFENSDAHATAVALAAGIRKIGQFDMILCGETSEDQYSFQVGPRTAEDLNLPQITYAVKVTPLDTKVAVERNLEDCYETVESTFPVFITVSREINEPRLPTLMAIMAASKKPMTAWTANDLGLKPSELGREGSLTEPLRSAVATGERKRVIIEGEPNEAAQKLVTALIAEGVVKVA